MVSALALIAILLGTAGTWPAAPRDSVGDGARLVVREARVAVEHDSAQAIMARWSSQLGRDSCDRRMLLGLATADDLYGALARGRPVIDALREAKLAANREGLPPRIWAAFQLVGDPATVVPLTAPRCRTVWWTGAGGLVVIAIVAAVRRSRASREGARKDA
jgi:hypothetical protein